MIKFESKMTAEQKKSGTYRCERNDAQVAARKAAAQAKRERKAKRGW